MNSSHRHLHPSFQCARSVRFGTERGGSDHTLQLLAGGPVVYGEPWASDVVAPDVASHLEQLCCVTEDSWPALVDGIPALVLVQEFEAIDLGDEAAADTADEVSAKLQVELPAIAAALRDRSSTVLGVTTDNSLSSYGRPSIVVALSAHSATGR